MKVFKAFDLTQYNSYRIKSSCAKAWFPETEDEVVALYKRGEAFILLGSGHNVILSKSYYDKEFMIFNGNFNSISIDADSGIIEAEAGAFMFDISEAALEYGLSGLEIFYDIPSSLGGAVVMNAGASGEEIKDVLVKVRYLDFSDMAIKEISRDEMNFEYRNSFFQRNTDKVVLKAWLKLGFKERTLIKEKMDLIKNQRWSKQPKEFPNAGSVFKRPKGYFVGALIDELNLKGYSVGGAKVSEKHGGFIVNFNNASGEDIVSIIADIKNAVHVRFGVDLEVEQRII